MKIRLSTGLASALALALLAAGCGGGNKDEQAAPPKDNASAGGEKVVWKKKTLKITMIAKSQNNPVFPTARVGAEAAAKEFGDKAGIKIDIDWQTPNEENAQEQASRLTSAVAGGTDCALMSLSDATKVTAAINDAVAKGVPVMTFDSDAPDSKRFAFYGVDDLETGAAVMKELADRADKDKKQLNVAILAGNQNAPNLKKRVQGAKDEAAKHPNIKVVGTYFHPETPQAAAAEVQQVNSANPSVNAWCMVGGWPLFTTSLLDLDPKKYMIVAVDCLPDELPYIDKGIAPVLLAQPTYEWGYQSVKIIVNSLIYGKTDKDPIHKMELVRVTKDNLKDWAHTLDKWGLKGINPDYLK